MKTTRTGQRRREKARAERTAMMRPKRRKKETTFSSINSFKKFN
jgi:hypothetical protein